MDTLTKEEILNQHKLSIKATMIFLGIVSFVLWKLWDYFGKIENPWLVIQPKNLESITAIITSNFLHVSFEHMVGNLLIFWIFGFFALTLEGTRAIKGMIFGVLFCGVAHFIFGDKGTMYLGFSGVVFALIGTVFISSIRSRNIFLIAAACGGIFFLGSNFFDTIRPTEFASINRISWLGHLTGFIGGVWYQVNNKSISLENLLKQDIINAEEYLELEDRIYGREVQEEENGSEGNDDEDIVNSSSEVDRGSN
ncbi:MAG: rhomboid family intramembrane serine protease [Calditrichaeota bacterium]|jgi:membrane associated rhomboid family serine protease|nr:rhomboid family intramembrane serine protease [Calditrichota bacterium]